MDRRFTSRQRPNDAGSGDAQFVPRVVHGADHHLLPNQHVPTLTVRVKEQEPRVPIPNAEWSFGGCLQGGNLTVNSDLLSGWFQGQVGFMK
jgi:hypothetical protein